MQPTSDEGDVGCISENIDPLVGDVITYTHLDGILVTHRAIERNDVSGQMVYRAQGDNIDKPRDAILGVKIHIIPNAGYYAQFLTGPVGFFVLIALPILSAVVIGIFQLIDMIGGEKKRNEGQSDKLVS